MKIMKRTFRNLLTAFKLILILLAVQGCKTTRTESDVENIDNSDPSMAAPDQESLGVCVSFGFTGQLENNLFLKRGVSVDLSERYFLRSALIEKGELYNVTMDRFDVFSNHGIVPESIYPYSGISSNKTLLDSNAQIKSQKGLDKFVPSKSMEGTLARLAELGDNVNVRADRKKYLSGDSIFGKLPVPNPEHPKSHVQIPVDAIEILDKTRVPYYEGVPCFKLPAEINTAVRWMTPYQFAKSCVMFDLQDYSEPELADNGLFHQKILKELEAKLDMQQVASIGAYVRDHRTAVFSSAPLRGYQEDFDVIDPKRYKATPAAGHAILLTGYLSREDLAEVKNHKKGFLKDTRFEEVDLLYDLNLTGIRERIYGEMFPFEEDLTVEAKGNLAKLIRKRAKARNQLWKAARQTRALRATMEDQEDWTELEQYKKILKIQVERAKITRSIDNEIVSARIAGLQFQRSEFEELLKAYQRHTSGPTGQPDEFPFYVKRDGAVFNAYLKGFSIPIKGVPVPARESLNERMLRRQLSGLGQVIMREGGLFIIRNSWGPGADPSVKGYNYMTYDYFLKYTDEMIW